jgi:shikimate dehydrogenase
MDLLGIDGLSVTMPHKAAVAASVKHRTPVVEALGVCNCVFRGDDGRLIGDSTDGDGFVRSLRLDDGLDLHGASVLVVGAGGAARSIIEAVGRAGAAEIVVAARTAAQAVAAAELAPRARPGSQPGSVAAGAEVAAADVVVNATPVGMTGGPDPDDPPVPVEALSDRQVVVDIVYEPRTTPLLAAAAERGATTIGGVGMLVHQAAIAFEHWTGAAAPVEVMLRAAMDRGHRPVG